MLFQRDKSGRQIYLFLLSAQGHCFLGNRLMGSFASVFFIHFSLLSLQICNISV